MAAFLFAASQSAYTYGDEGWYVLAAQLINAGKRPYADFFYQHTPLDIYFTAAWMRLFGDNWRSVHACSAVLLSISAGLIAYVVFTRVQNTRWKVALAGCAAVLFGTNTGLKMAVLSAPYALSICLVFAAFLLSLRAISTPNFPAVWAGLCAGLAVDTSLLNAALGPLLLLFLVVELPPAARLKQALFYSLGCLVGVLPLGWFALRAGREMFFDVITFQIKYRSLAPKFWHGKNVLLEDLKTYASVLNSTQGLLLIVFALLGFGYVLSAKRGNSRLIKDLRICGFVAMGLTASVCLVRASFSQYFLIVLPMLIILTVTGLFAVGTRVLPARAPLWIICGMLLLYDVEGAKSWGHQLFKPETTWTEDEQIGNVIKKIVPPAAAIYSDDGAVYAMAKRIPPRGLENNYAFTLPPELARRVHAVAQCDIDRLTDQGKFFAVVEWGRDDPAKLRHLETVFREHQVFPTHELFWHWAGDPTASTKQPILVAQCSRAR